MVAQLTFHILAMQAELPTAGTAGATGATAHGFIPPSVIVWAFIAVGFGLAIGVFGYIVRTRRDALTLLKGFIGGGGGAAFIGAFGSKISGLSTQVTWAEAAFIATLSFVGSMILVSVVSAVLFYFLIVKPITVRFGDHHAVRVWTEFWTGIDPLREWISTTIRDTHADPSWDEFACAFVLVAEAMRGTEEASEVVADFVDAVDPKNLGALPDEAAIDLLRQIIGPPIDVLAARLTQTTLNFSVWRVHATDDTLEHLISMPVDHGHEAGHGHKPALPIWSSLMKSQSGSLAGEALLTESYQWMTPAKCSKHWPRRQLGRKYDAVAAMPIPCDGTAEAPWAVICVESRDGRLPVDSHTVRLFMGTLARAIHATHVEVSRRTVAETRMPRPGNSGAPGPTTQKTPVAEPHEPTLPSGPTAHANGTHVPDVRAPGAASGVGDIGLEKETKPLTPVPPGTEKSES